MAAADEDGALALQFLMECGIDIKALRDKPWFDFMAEFVGDSIDEAIGDYVPPEATPAADGADDDTSATAGAVGVRRPTAKCSGDNRPSSLYSVVGDKDAVPCVLQKIDDFSSQLAAVTSLAPLISKEPLTLSKKDLLTACRYWHVIYHGRFGTKQRYVFPYFWRRHWCCFRSIIPEGLINTDTFYVIVVEDHYDKSDRPKFPWGTKFILGAPAK